MSEYQQDAGLPEVFATVVELGLARGMKAINQLKGCWEHQIDEHWWLALNGHPEPTGCSRGADVPPFHCYFEFNGWPAGIASPSSGMIAAGDAANEGALLAALQKALEEA